VELKMLAVEAVEATVLLLQKRRLKQAGVECDLSWKLDWQKKWMKKYAFQELMPVLLLMK
jgi:hypothetical protein